MATTVPRWEWRAFDERFGPAEDRLGAIVAEAIQESDELYILSEAGDNVKVRYGLLDIKALREVNADGLEQWVPVLKAGFPLAETDATRAYEALRLEPPSTLVDGLTLEQLVDGIARTAGRVRSVQVHKRRTRYTVRGCSAELTDIEADGRPTRTVAVESEDPKAVIAAVRELGLGGYVNTSYPRGLAALLVGETARYAVIDVGTNSVKFHVGERAADGTWRRVIDRAEVTRLGEGLAESGRIGNEPRDRTAAAIADMADEAKQNRARAVVAVGTAGLRMAGNRDEVVSAIRERAGVDVEIISGEDEARLAYRAAVAGVRPGARALVVFDTGGGSSQFTWGRGAVVDAQFSVPVGAARFTERFGLAGAVAPAVLAQAMTAIAADLSAIEGRALPDAVVAMGGAVTNMAAVKHQLAAYDPDVVQGTVLDLAEIERQIELYRSRDADSRRAIVGLQPKRAEVILAGACIVRTVMDKLGQKALMVSDRSLRHGLLVERFGP